MRRKNRPGRTAPSSISIHAPHAGCDWRDCFCPGRRKYFNPRTPCGVRLAHLGEQSVLNKISIHAPHAGCDGRRLTVSFFEWYFNPRTPCGVRRAQQRAKNQSDHISIHAPHAGCDYFILTIAPSAFTFQSTHPMRGATRFLLARACSSRYFNPRTPCGVRLNDRQRENIDVLISIHAPHAGCDLL